MDKFRDEVIKQKMFNKLAHNDIHRIQGEFDVCVFMHCINGKLEPSQKHPSLNAIAAHFFAEIAKCAPSGTKLKNIF